MNEILPLSKRGMNGTTGGWSFPTLIRYDRWFRLGSMRLSNSVYSLRNFEGSFSHVSESRLTATLLSPITMAKKAFRFWYSLQLQTKSHMNLIIIGMRKNYLWSELKYQVFKVVTIKIYRCTCQSDICQKPLYT
jgi:hypothetical protein